MSIEELKELYINKSEDVDSKTLQLSKSIFGENINGDSFWSIGIDYVYELIKLLGNTENYNQFDIEKLENLLDNEKIIQDLLKTVSETDYVKLKEILTLNDSVKKMLYDYIKSKLLQIKLKQWRSNLTKKDNVEYIELNSNSFHTDEEGNYIAKNVLFHNLKVEKIEIIGDQEEGLKTIRKINQQYMNDDLRKMCIEMLVNGDLLDWENDITSFEECSKLLTGEVQYIEICNNEMNIWFNTSESDSFGGHNPVLSLYADKEYKCVGIE